MIATILPSGTTFHAVNYNEKKVSEGCAVLLEMKNMGICEMGRPYKADDLVSYLTVYSSMNGRIKKPQFHVAISCKGNEYNEEELVDFAHQYLHEMGYDEEGQPLLIYAHRDTGNTHIHIVTSRVSPTGRKIDHNHERRKSLQVVEKLTKQNIKGKMDADLANAKAYSFANISQFCSILNSMGYETFKDKKNTAIYVKRGGIIRTRISVEEISALIQSEQKDKKRTKQLKAILYKYKNISDNIEQLNNELKKKFGIDIILAGSIDKPKGFVLVDHRNKDVVKGSNIMPVHVLMKFDTADERKITLQNFIRTQLNDNPGITTPELNYKLARSNATVRNHSLYYKSGKETYSEPLDETLADRLKINNRISIVNRFMPQSREECEILCKIYKIPENDWESVKISDTPHYTDETIDKFKVLFSQYQGTELRAILRGEGYLIKRRDDGVFLINLTNRTIMDLRRESLNIAALHHTSKHNKQEQTHHSSIQPNAKTEHVERGLNREWEIDRGHQEGDEMENSKLKY